MLDELIPTCDKCGKVMPILEDMSNDNWTGYAMVCPCGGRGEFKEIAAEVDMTDSTK